MKPLKRIAAILLMSCLPTGALLAETLASDRKLSVVLDDGTDVLLYGETGQSSSGKINYFYLPPQLSISENEQGSPEFLFLKYISDEAEDSGGVSGAILHFLVDWGLTPAQEEELDMLLKTEHDGTLGGAATMHASAEAGPSFYIVSATVGDDSLGGKLVTSGQASLVPGGLAAVAARLDPYGAQILAETFEADSTITDLTAVMNMEYAVQVQGVQGTVEIDWSRIERDTERLSREYAREIENDGRVEESCAFLWWGCDDERRADYTYSYNEVQSQFSYLSEREYVKFDFVQGDIPEEVAAPVRDAFIQYFISSVTQANAPTPEANRTDDDNGEAEDFDVRQGAGYSYNINKVKSLVQRGSQKLSLDLKLSVRYPHQLVGNMKSWYSLADAADPYSIQEVVLGDQLFQRRDIVFTLDGNVEDIFDEQVNMVSIEVQKDRGDDPPFADSIVITPEVLTEKGNLARVTYARGSSPNSGSYRYKVRWNFRGGHTHTQPESGWLEGDWEGMTLAAPIEPRLIELEGDVNELKDLGVTRVTAQVRHPLLGNEEETNLQLSVAGGNPLESKTLYIDEGAEGYVYRLIFNHRRLGRLASPWSKRLSDNYIYAGIPDELADQLVESADVTDVEVVSDAQAAVEGESGGQLENFNIQFAGE